MKRAFFISIFVISSTAYAQMHTNLADTTVNGELLQVSYSFEWPFADMGNRFGTNNSLGGGLYFKRGNNWLLGAEANYFFGGNIKEDSILDGLKTTTGNFVGIDGLYDVVVLYERGFSFFLSGGKIFPVFHSNPNSGITAAIGAGFLQHKIKITQTEGQLPQLKDDYLEGYDRLTNGFALHQYIGYTNLDKRRLLNFSIGIEAKEAFTANRRDWNFDEMKKDDTQRLDVLIGLRATFILPFYGSNEERMYTY